MRRGAKSEFITRIDVQHLLGVDRSKVKRMQRSGELPSVRDERGIHRFPRELVEQMAGARGRIVGAAPGPITAKAFAMFAQGKTWQEVVIALEQPTEVVRDLLAKYREKDEPSSAKLRTVRQGANPEDDALEPEDDLDAWQHEQREALRRAQAQLEYEQRAWEEAQRGRPARARRV